MDVPFILKNVFFLSLDSNSDSNTVVTDEDKRSTETDDYWSSTESESDISEVQHVEVDMNQLRQILLKEKNEEISIKFLRETDQSGLFYKERLTLTFFMFFLCVWKTMFFISNRSFEFLLLVLYHVFVLLGLHDMFLSACKTVFPRSLFLLHKFLGLDRNDFDRYVVCPSCTKLYNIEDVVNERVSKCYNSEFSKGRYSKPCSTELGRRVQLKDGHCVMYPHKIYCYKSITSCLKEILSRPGIEKECEKWRTERTQNVYSDIYDGEVWQTFELDTGIKFFSQPYNLGLMLNIDWFQPFERRKDISVGVIYMSILNIPRHERFKRENMILIGIIPHLKKEPSDVNHFLEPLVKELQLLQNGIQVNTHMKPLGTIIRAVLLCVSADIPASRKICGFLSHAGRLGCSKCLCEFPRSFQEGANYSNFDMDSWIPRTKAYHENALKKIKKCKTKTEQKRIESYYGCRYSVLTKLSYWDPVRHHVIDPMHNLFEGTAKAMFRLYVERSILTSEKMEILESSLRRMKYSYDIGKFPLNIASNWTSLTADNWKMWTLHLSMYALKDILPEQDYKCWQTFVLACRKIVKPQLSKNDANLSRLLFAKFGSSVATLYGEMFVKPNMHLSCHLSQCIIDYGSIYGFWCFAYERTNGILGSYHTNNRDFEIQLMREFLTSMQLCGIQQCIPNTPVLSNLFDLLHEMKSGKKTETIIFGKATCILPIVDCENHWGNLDNISLSPKSTPMAMDSDDLNILLQTYQAMYPNLTIELVHLSRLYFKHSFLSMGTTHYGSSLAYRSLSNSRIVASWCGENNTHIKASGVVDENDVRPGIIKYFMKHTALIHGKPLAHVFAVLSWYKPSEMDFGFLKPITVWSADLRELPGPAMFMPVHRIFSKYAYAVHHHNNRKYLIISPMRQINII